MKSLIHALNDSYRASATAAEDIAGICETNPKAAYLVDMILNSPSYDVLCEEYFNETIRKRGEPRLQLFFSTMSGEQVVDLCELNYMLSVMDTLDVLDMTIEAVENVLRGNND